MSEVKQQIKREFFIFKLGIWLIGDLYYKDKIELNEDLKRLCKKIDEKDGIVEKLDENNPEIKNLIEEIVEEFFLCFKQNLSLPEDEIIPLKRLLKNSFCVSKN